MLAKGRNDKAKKLRSLCAPTRVVEQRRDQAPVLVPLHDPLRVCASAGRGRNHQMRGTVSEGPCRSTKKKNYVYEHQVLP